MDIITDGITYDVKSVIKDGVEYQFPGVSQEEYDELLARYNGEHALVNGLALKPYMVDGQNIRPNVKNFVSFSSNIGGIGGSFMILDGSSYFNCVFVGFKKVAGGDITYHQYYSSGFPWYSYFTPTTISYWDNGTSMKCYFFPFKNGPTYECHEVIWNYTGGITYSLLGTGSSVNPNDYGASLTGYTEITDNSWIGSVYGERIEEDAYINVTLK